MVGHGAPYDEVQWAGGICAGKMPALQTGFILRTDSNVSWCRRASYARPQTNRKLKRAPIAHHPGGAHEMRAYTRHPVTGRKRGIVRHGRTVLIVLALQELAVLGGLVRLAPGLVEANEVLDMGSH